jgi:hypothetical protein
MLFTGRVSFAIIIIAAWSCALAGCAANRPFEPIATRQIEFRCDQEINGGLILPVDVIYISYVDELREVARYGPDEWFASERRGFFKQKTSLSLKGAQTLLLDLDRDLLTRTRLIVVYVDYAGISDPAAQQVVIDYAGLEKEVIFVKEDRLIPENKQLTYIQ